MANGSFDIHSIIFWISVIFFIIYLNWFGSVEK